jgi:hypothetical protein
MPPDSRLVYYPPRPVFGWKGWTDESFGRLVAVDPEETRERWPAEAGDPPPDAFDEWVWRLRRSGVGVYIEGSRDRHGRWEISINGPESQFRSEAVRQILPGLRLLRTVISRRGGRPRGRTKRSPQQVTEAIRRFQSGTGTNFVPSPRWLAQRLDVSVETARKYLRQLRNAGGNR